MDDIFLANHPTPEDYNKAVKMDSGSVETAPDRESPRSPATPAYSIDGPWKGSPAMTMSSDTPISAPVTTPPTEPTDAKLARLQIPGPLRLSTHSGGSEHSSHQRPPTALRPHTRLYELEATTAFKTVASGGSMAYQRRGTSQGSSEKSCDLRKDQGDGTPSRSTTRPKLVNDVGTTPATGLYHSKASDTIKKERNTEEQNESDPFLGPGKPMEPLSFSNGVTRRSTVTELPSPSLTRLRSSQLGETPGLATIHKAHNEVLSLLDMLRATHRAHTRSEVRAALWRCEDDLRARSKDKAIGTAEANILDREASRIGRTRVQPTKQALGNYDPPSDGKDEALQTKLRLALARLVAEAHAALDTMAQTETQAASVPREEKEHTAHHFGDDARVMTLLDEERTLKDQVDRFHAETSGLQKQLDGLAKEVKAYRRDFPNTTLWGPWGKEWIVGSKRGE